MAVSYKVCPSCSSLFTPQESMCLDCGELLEEPKRAEPEPAPQQEPAKQPDLTAEIPITPATAPAPAATSEATYSSPFLDPDNTITEPVDQVADTDQPEHQFEPTPLQEPAEDLFTREDPILDYDGPIDHDHFQIGDDICYSQEQMARAMQTHWDDALSLVCATELAEDFLEHLRKNRRSQLAQHVLDEQTSDDPPDIRLFRLIQDFDHDITPQFRHLELTRNSLRAHCEQALRDKNPTAIETINLILAYNLLNEECNQQFAENHPNLAAPPALAQQWRNDMQETWRIVHTLFRRFSGTTIEAIQSLSHADIGRLYDVATHTENTSLVDLAETNIMLPAITLLASLNNQNATRLRERFSKDAVKRIDTNPRFRGVFPKNSESVALTIIEGWMLPWCARQAQLHYDFQGLQRRKQLQRSIQPWLLSGALAVYLLITNNQIPFKLGETIAFWALLVVTFHRAFFKAPGSYIGGLITVFLVFGFIAENNIDTSTLEYATTLIAGWPFPLTVGVLMGYAWLLERLYQPAPPEYQLPPPTAGEIATMKWLSVLGVFLWFFHGTLPWLLNEFQRIL